MRVTQPTLPEDHPVRASPPSVSDPRGNNGEMITTETDSRLATIRALLAKAEATTYAAEAEAFTAKASELMARYALDEAMVWASGGDDRDVPTEIRLLVHRPFTAQKAVLVNSVAEVYGCRALRLGALGAEGAEHISVVGFASDLTLVETLVTSLFLQLTTAMTAHDAGRPGGSASQVAAWRRSFIMGFAHTVTERLIADRRNVAQATEAETVTGDTAASVALVLRDRSDSVAAEFRQRYPRIRTSKVSSGTSAAGRRAGTSAGRAADLGHQRLGAHAMLGSGD